MGEIIKLTLSDGDVLLPCPFCGSQDLELANTWTAFYWVECETCGAEVSDREFVDRNPDNMSHHQASKQAALAAWNRRVTPIGAVVQEPT